MKVWIVAFSMIVWGLTANAQIDPGTPGIKMLADGGSVRGITGETVGITDVIINYGRPGVKGREGKIWGDIVPEGMSANPFFPGKQMPWRAGANENTTISFSTDVFIEGQKLAAGKYGLHMIYNPEECTVIFSESNGSWGSYYYEEEDDVLRVKVKPVKKEYSTERLTYDFSGQTDSSAVVSVVWEKQAIPFTVSTNLQELQVVAIEEHMNTTKSFNPQSYLEAAKYYYKQEIYPERALQYAAGAKQMLRSFYPSYLTYKVLQKQGDKRKADSAINEAIAAAPANELGNYGFRLLQDKDYATALAIFKKKCDENSNDYTSMIGMAKTYSAMGNNKTALKYANRARKALTDEKSRAKVDDMIAKLKAGEDINT